MDPEGESKGEQESQLESLLGQHMCVGKRGPGSWTLWSSLDISSSWESQAMAVRQIPRSVAYILSEHALTPGQTEDS